MDQQPGEHGKRPAAAIRAKPRQRRTWDGPGGGIGDGAQHINRQTGGGRDGGDRVTFHIDGDGAGRGVQGGFFRRRHNRPIDPRNATRNKTNFAVQRGRPDWRAIGAPHKRAANKIARRQGRIEPAGKAETDQRPNPGGNVGARAIGGSAGHATTDMNARLLLQRFRQRVDTRGFNRHAGHESQRFHIPCDTERVLAARRLRYRAKAHKGK